MFGKVLQTSSLLVCMILFLGIFSCATAEKSAKKLFESGDYDGAETAYLKILEKDPGNVDAKSGVSASRSKILDNRLITIRKTRQGGTNTILMMLDLLDLEKKWNLQPPGAAIFTQSDEIDKAATQALILMTDPSYDGLPLKRQLEITRDERLFQESHSWDFSMLKSRTQNEGKKICKEFIKKSTGKFPYYDTFISKFCDFWGADVSPKISTEIMDQELAPAVITSFNLKDFPEQTENQISARLNDALHVLPWFSPSGKSPIQITLTGSWKQDVKRTPTQLVYTYQDQESYIENVQVTKTRQTPVNRNFPYGAWQIKQRLELSFQGTAQLRTAAGTQSIPLGLQEVSNTADTESDISNPGIGLKKKEALLIPNAQTWLNSHEAQLATQFSDVLKALWKSTYCIEVPLEDMAKSGEAVQKCLKLGLTQNSPAPAFLDAWYLKYFGIDRKSAHSMLK